MTIPLVKEMQLLSKPNDTIQFTLMSRAQGVTLLSIWDTIKPEQRGAYVKQLADALVQLRQYTAPVAQKVDGSLLDDTIIGCCGRRHPPTCKKIGNTTDKWFKNMGEELRRGLSKIHKVKDPVIIKQKMLELKRNFPKGEPYVLTHGDLNLSNIIVKDDKIEAIIDWEMAGYYPWWVERWISRGDLPGEFHRALWARVCPDMNNDQFDEQVSTRVMPLIRAWRACVIEHPDSRSKWRRPGFCECKPYAGDFTLIGIGKQPEHKVNHHM